jgi:hypothetical protein
MNLMDKVGHTVLKRGDIVKAPSGSNDWVVIDHDLNGKIVLACISKYMNKEESDLMGWYKLK